MRVEKISNNQMKFVLMMSDLEARDINISELSYASDKTQQLFKEIMQMVQNEEEFSSEEGTPLMFEAMRMGVDSLVVVVTKISEGVENAARQFNLIPVARNECKFKRAGLTIPPDADDDSGLEDSHVMFSFEDLDIMASAVVRIDDIFEGPSQVYKMDERYFLTIQNETPDDRNTSELEAILHEFGQKHVSNVVSRQYLVERGEIFIAYDAVEKLRAYYNAM